MRNIWLLFLLCPLFLQAQDSLSTFSYPNSPVLKFSHLSLIDPLSSIQFALEYQVGKKVSLQHEAGYITNLVVNDPTYKSVKGIRLRNEVRFYLQEKGKDLEGFYLGPEFLFIYFKHRRRGVQGFGCEDFNCDYYQDTYYNSHQQVYALHAKIGYQSIFKRLAVDLYTGIGYRHVRVNDGEKPSTSFFDSDDEYFDFRKEEGVYHLPGFSLGFKVGYVLNGK